mmetsp:Transcript_39734/g.95887  ORF Transcript_39734/g.95887 Transcript_39734/m.95887 type:complete len:562 (+) Transcript_39734:408-2093(+)
MSDLKAMKKKKSPLSLSNHSKSSHHGRGEFVSITVRKDDPKEKAGIRLEQESNGRLRVSNIAANGLFGRADDDVKLEIGDIILSINAKRLSAGQGPEDLLKVANDAKTTITVVVKKQQQPPAAAGASAIGASGESVVSSGSAKSKTKEGKTLTRKKSLSKKNDNNVTVNDNYFRGNIMKHNEDGSLVAKFTKEDEELKLKKGSGSGSGEVKATSITATRTNGTSSEEKRDHGLTLEVQNKMLFVADISNDEDSNMFSSSTNLKVGDRVLSINDMNFRTYPDADYAHRILDKAGEVITLVVEHNAKGFVPSSSTKTKPKRTSSMNSTSSSLKRASLLKKKKNGASLMGSSSSAAKKTIRSSILSATDSDGTGETEDASDSSDEEEGGLNDTEDETRGTFAAGTQCAKSNSVKRGSKVIQDAKKGKKRGPKGKPRGGDRYENDFKIEAFKEVTITQPKQFTKQLVGVDFKFDDKIGLVYVYKIDKSSLFFDTSLEEGDWILSVNDVNIRNTERDVNFDARRVATKTCLQAKESVSFVVLKDETTYKTKTFNLDNSISDLEWVA